MGREPAKGTSLHGSPCTRGKDGGPCVRCAGFQPGNLVAGKSLAESEQTIGPLRRELDVELAVDFPELDGRRRAILADRLARLSVAWQWLDKQEGLVRNKRGEPWPLLVLVEMWGKRAETILGELEAERREDQRPVGLAAQMAALERAGR